MFHWFFYDFTPNYPYFSSAVKFLILGFIGEWLGGLIRTKGHLFPFPIKHIPFKLLIWAILGVLIKWAFSSFVLMVKIQSNNGLLPQICYEPNSIFFALAVSIEINIFFAPFMMYFHRFMDNLIDKKNNYNGMKIAIYSIAWFWIPAHTVTFMLPENFRILFAASLSVALGIILGFSSKK